MMKQHILLRARLTTCMALVFALSFVGGAGAATAASDCDPAFVTQQGGLFTVLPTGTDDTANLQCAFDAAVDAGPGAEVRLPPGAYHTAQIVVNEFRGSFSGAGADKTAVFNLPNLYVTPADFNVNPPSAGNPWPILFSFVGGDFSISGLAFRITGDEPTLGWTFWGMGPFHELACAVMIGGPEAHADVGHVLVEGEAAEGWLFQYNLINGIYFEGWMEWMGQPSPPISGSFSVHHSTFRTQDSALPLYNLSNASVVISHNDVGDTVSAMLVSDLVDSSVEFSHNEVEATLGLDFYDDILPEQVRSTLLITNNVFHTEVVGLALEQTFGEGNRCLLLGNNVQGVADQGIYLGPATIGCTVVGGSSKTNVVDLGTGNVLTGVNNMGTGVGPTIRSFMRMKK
jgi:hypothetical protein